MNAVKVLFNVISSYQIQLFWRKWQGDIEACLRFINDSCYKFGKTIGTLHFLIHFTSDPNSPFAESLCGEAITANQAAPFENAGTWGLFFKLKNCHINTEKFTSQFIKELSLSKTQSATQLFYLNFSPSLALLGKIIQCIVCLVTLTSKLGK